MSSIAIDSSQPQRTRYIREPSLDQLSHIPGTDGWPVLGSTLQLLADPKGVVLTHRNYTANVEQSLSRIDIPSSYRTLIILPLDHCFAHVVGFYIMIACGATVATVQVGATPMETLKNIPQNIREVRPHFLLSVPALAKNFRKNIESSIRASSSSRLVAKPWNSSPIDIGTASCRWVRPILSTEANSSPFAPKASRSAARALL